MKLMTQCANKETATKNAFKTKSTVGLMLTGNHPSLAPSPPCSLAYSLPPYRKGVPLDIVFMHISLSNIRVPFVRKTVKGKGNAFELCSCFTTCGQRIDGLTIGEFGSCSSVAIRLSYSGSPLQAT